MKVMTFSILGEPGPGRDAAEARLRERSDVVKYIIIIYNLFDALFMPAQLY